MAKLTKKKSPFFMVVREIVVIKRKYFGFNLVYKISILKKKSTS